MEGYSTFQIVMPDGRQDWQAERKKTSIFRTSLGNIIIEAGHEPYRVKFPMQVNDVFKSGSLRESVTKRSVACRGGQSLSIDIHKSSSESCRSTHQEAFFVLESPISLDDRKMLLNVPATFASRIAEPGVEGQRRYLQIPLTAAGSISPLLTLTNEEMSFERRTRCKIVLSVAGICEAQSGSKKAYAWYQKKIFGLGDHNSHEGIGIAQVTLDETDSRRLVGQRCLRGAMLFNQHEPRFGQFAVSKGEGDGYIYLWGKQLDKVFLARVHAGNVVERSKYEFYNGRCFTTEMSKMNSVLEGLACGSIFTSQIFGHRYPWVLIGHNRPHNEVICGRSEAPEGPFQATPIFGGLTGKTIERFHSQIIVHPWGSREDLGQFFVTWNERNPEKVIEGSLRFGMR